MDSRCQRLGLGLPLWLGLALLSARPATGQDPGPNDAPSGTLAFFSPDTAACPTGWRVATEAAGRLIVGVTVGDSVGRLVGTALSNEQDRTHFHPYTTMVTLPSRNIAAADGSNDQGAAAMTYQDAGSTGASPSGL